MSVGRMRALGRCGKGRGLEMFYKREREGTMNIEEREVCFKKEKRGCYREFTRNKGDEREGYLIRVNFFSFHGKWPFVRMNI